MSEFETARRIVQAHTGSAFPAAVVDVGCHDHALWQEAFGHVHHEPDAPPATLETVFDLASLTKVLATTSLAMTAVDQRVLAISDLVSRWLPDWRTEDRRTVTIEHLLAHESGLTAYLPFFRDHRGRSEFEKAICTLPLEYPPRSTSVYSDLGFILLGFILEDAVGLALASQFARFVKPRGWDPIGFRPGADVRGRTAPTEVDPWRGRWLVGEVHDENTWALGGAAGHAGLFGPATAVGQFARAVLHQFRGESPLATRATFERFVTRSTVPGSTRALGWDTMKPTSSCGRRMSAAAIGHTGFTGTSLWIDPEADVYVVLLTNRVCPTRDNDAILDMRPRFHDAVMEAMAVFR